MSFHPMLRLLGRALAMLCVMVLLAPPLRAQTASPKASAGVATAPKPTAKPKDKTAASAGQDPSGHLSAPAERAARLERYHKWAKDWRERRETHKKARLKRLHYRLNRVLKGAPITEAVRRELSTHARRLARLYRLKEVAVEKEDEDAVMRIDDLVHRENARHEHWLEEQQKQMQKQQEAPKP